MPDDFARTIIAAHQDFHGIVTPDDPAVAGEVLHFYMTGLGDVQPRPPTGAPPEGLTFGTVPICSVSSQFATEAAPVEFAGLAPGMVGIYQVDVAIPAGYPTSAAIIRCFDEAQPGRLTGDSGAIPIRKR